jgi:hypothetical protein
MRFLFGAKPHTTTSSVKGHWFWTAFFFVPKLIKHLMHTKLLFLNMQSFRFIKRSVPKNSVIPSHKALFLNMQPLLLIKARLFQTKHASYASDGHHAWTYFQPGNGRVNGRVKVRVNEPGNGRGNGQAKYPWISWAF